MEVLYLSSNDVRKLITMEETLEAVENVFKDKALGNTIMPSKIYVNFEDGDFRSMPCYIKSLNAAGIKIVNVHPKNRERFNLPTVMAKILLINPASGYVYCIMDGTIITDYRTGAGGGVAVKYLARKDSKVISLVGAGNQAKTQLLAIKEIIKNIEEVRVWSRTFDTAKKFKEDMENFGFNIVVKNSIEETVRNCDILVTTTPATEPLIRNEFISNGVHINAIGADAPGKEELDPKILLRSKIVVDDYEQAIHSGEVNVPISKGIISKENIYAELGEIVAGLKKGRESDEEITIFDSTGLAIQDIATAYYIYQKAVKNGIGKYLEA
ncbi:MAG: alanine dehydrogenase [Candidatus Aenigmarchaeota archaeon]|nr:alanine dehydrogenase [Candidatus Aenigmarchaeota archaeon]MDW8149203.1 alanine dehydrogenase [Candidatus Aenigmarchaeota archaeon]